MEERETPGAAFGPSAQPAPRRAYEKPVLQVYGDLTQITRSVRTSGSNDGAAHPNKHFTA